VARSASRASDLCPNPAPSGWTEACGFHGVDARKEGDTASFDEAPLSSTGSSGAPLIGMLKGAEARWVAVDRTASRFPNAFLDCAGTDLGASAFIALVKFPESAYVLPS
jgi:hypothetical protein